MTRKSGKRSLSKHGRRLVVTAIAVVITVSVIAPSLMFTAAAATDFTTTQVPASTTVSPGTNVTFNVTLQNPATDSDSVALDVDLPAGWNVTAPTGDTCSANCDPNATFKGSEIQWLWFSPTGTEFKANYTVKIPADAVDGTYTIDAKGNFNNGTTFWHNTSSTVTVDVPPTADFDFSPTDPVTGEQVTFNASASNDGPNGSITSYEWDLDDDGSFDDATSVEVSHTFASSGEKNVSLRVTDNEGTTNTTTQTVTVSSEILVGGRLNESDDTPAAADFLQFAGRFGNGDSATNVTSAQGEFAVTLLSDETYDVRYYQDDPRTTGDIAFPKDGNVDVLAADRVSFSAPTTDLNGTLPVGHNLTVTVVNESGDPVENATVHVVSHTDVPDSDDPIHAGVSADTNAAGDLVHPESDGPGFEVNGTVHVQVQGTADLLRNGTTIEVDADRHLTLTAHPAANVSGQVAEANGDPAANDTIRWRGRDVQHGEQNVTTDQGAFDVRLIQGATYELVYYQDDPRSSDDVAFPKDGSVDVYTPGTVQYAADTAFTRTLPEGHNLTVEVVDPNGDPIENATVHVIAIGNVTGSEDVRAHVAAETNASGHLVHPESDGPGFEVNGTVQVFVEGPGDRYFPNGTTIEVSADRHLVGTLHPKVTVSGQVAEAGGDPAANDSIQWRGRDVRHGAHNVTTDQGAFSADLIENATYELVYHQDDPRSNADVAFPKDGSVDLYTPGTVRYTADTNFARTLPEGHNLTVTVVDESGTPVQGVPVHVAHVQAVSGSDRPVRAHVEVATNTTGDVVHPESDGPGFEVNGTARVFVEGSAVGYFDNGTTVEVSADRHVTIVLEPAVTVTGQILEPDNSGASLDFVVARNQGTFRDSQTDAGGNFTIAIPAAEQVSLAAVQFNETSGSPMVRDGVVDLYEFAEVNRTTDGDLGTTTLPAGHVLNITVVNESGVPVEGARVGVAHHGQPNVRSAALQFTTNADGLFQGNNVPPGIEVTGDVTVAVQPPESSTAFKEQFILRNETVTQDTNITVTLDEVDTTPPTITNASAVDAADGDLNVTHGDAVEVTVDITDNEGVALAVVNASDLGAGFVELTDADGDGTFNATFHVDAANASADGDHQLWVGARDSADNVASSMTNALTLDTTPPTVTNAQATDLTDGDGNVSDGDEIEVSVDVADSLTGVDTVAVNATAFGAGIVELTDDDGDGTYDGTFLVDESNAAGAGNHSMTVGANDTAGNFDVAETNELRFRRVTRVNASTPGFTMGIALVSLLVSGLLALRYRRD